ncbi:MAG: RNA polymerase sigma factor [Bryobacteraceae bacterium]|jgi:RNA polymerase sigma-70 factor (ECF subfamily)
MPPDALILEYYAGSDAAFSEFYGQFWHVLIRFLVHLGAESFLAEDLAQETMYRIARTRARGARFDPASGSLKGWALSAARNIWLDHLKRRRRRIQEQVSMDERTPGGLSPVEPSQPACQETELLANETGECLRASLFRLPAEQREAVLLHDFENLTYDEIGRTIGVPAATVASRRKLAIEKLRVYWSGGQTDGQGGAE